MTRDGRGASYTNRNSPGSPRPFGLVLSSITAGAAAAAVVASSMPSGCGRSDTDAGSPHMGAGNAGPARPVASDPLSFIRSPHADTETPDALSCDGGACSPVANDPAALANDASSRHDIADGSRAGDDAGAADLRDPTDPTGHIEITLSETDRPDTGKLAPGIFLAFPSCLPSCAAADQDRLIAGARMEEKIVLAVRGARTTIDFATPTLERPGIVSALVLSAKRGVRVRGIVGRRPFGAAPSGAVELEKALAGSPDGGGVKPPPGSGRIHDSFLLADGELLIHGSPEWSAAGLAFNIESLETVTRRSSPERVRAFSCKLEALWSGDPERVRRALPDCQSARDFFTPASPLAGILPELLRRVDASRQTLSIAGRRFTSPEITSALVRAAARGVKVRMVVDDDECATRAPEAIDTLEKAGAEIRYLRTSCELDQALHAQLALFDGSWVITGSGGFTKATMITDHASFVLHDDPAHVDAFDMLFDRVWRLSWPRLHCACNTALPECRKRRCLDRPGAR